MDFGLCRRGDFVFGCFSESYSKRRSSGGSLKMELDSPRASSRPGGASSVIGRRVEVCLWRISQDLIGVCLRWIHVDPIFIHLCSCVYRLDPSDVHISSSAVVAILVRWSMGLLHDDSPTVYYNKVCPALMREGQ